MARQPTIKDVAKAAKVSTATVSRALKQPELLANATRERVLEAVRQVNYTPNLMARNLRRQETKSIFLVVRDMRNPFYLEVFSGVEEEARALGYTVLMGNTEDSIERAHFYFDLVRARHADGLILMTGKLPDILDDLARDQLPPLVVALEYFTDFHLPTVRIDNEAAAADAVRHLIALGHTRIAHISGPIPEIMSTGRHDGYVMALTESGQKADPAMTVRGDFTMASGHSGCRRLMARDNPPTAIFCANDEMAMGAINELRELGYSVPHDISVIGFDDIVFAGAFYPPLTTVRQPRHDIGKTAMRLLNGALIGAPNANEEVIMPTELVVRGSTAPPKQN